MKPKLAIGLLTVAAILAWTGVAGAQTAPPTPDLLDRLAVLEATVQALHAKVTALETEVATLKSSQVMALNQYLTVTTGDQPRALFSGLNLQLVNGTGQTDSTNGRGNLILGYDAARHDEMYFCSDGQFTEREACERAGQTWATSHKTGSHYLVIGDRNNYAQYGGLVVGTYNTSTGPGASVSGGRENKASGPYANVSGGTGNAARGPYTSVSGGESNAANGPAATVSGGTYNIANGAAASVNGGEFNTASGSAASVSGGLQRSATGPQDWVAGGLIQDQ
jgi:hypothetical protein